MSGSRIKYKYQVVDHRAGGCQLPLLAVSIHHGVVPRSTLTDDLPRADDLSNYKVCERGDIVLNRMRAFQGAVGISPQRGIVSPDYLVVRPGADIDARYLHHLFRSTWFVGEMVSRLRGIGNTESGAVRTPRINPEDLGDIRAPLPPLEEQRRIADFLDAETSRIDQLVALQSAAAIKLRDREVVQRDIAVDRLIERGEVAPLRRFVWSVDQGSSPQCDSTPAAEGEWGVLKVSCLRPGIFNPEENKRLPDDVEPDKGSEVREGDLLITRANTPQLVGSTAVVGAVRSRLLLSDKIFRVRLIARMSPRYVAEVAAGTRVRALCAATSNGASQSMANIRFEEVKAWPIPVVGLDEQQRFVEEMSQGRELLTQVHNAVERQICLLNERRQALITAAVTGQFDVTTASGRKLKQGV
ncbi:restriction endonuclease subunit S [Nocardia nova]|uniref:restriction endonuclease subunit S n=1 Tax=Nocardia nova TaxID=37330 RepID=UPI0018936923|nr:restriction endonuclease subunit S [Nocardia nova]MBF6148041.1 restriction endonuclease subunit S [Nocardia nova]